METGTEIFLKSLLHGAAYTFLLGGVLLWMRRRDRDRSRGYLACVFFLSGLIFLVRLLASYAGLPPTPAVLPVVNLYGGLVALLMLYFYPIEVISPGWLTFRRGILLFAPCWLLGLLLVCVPIHFRELYSFGDLAGHIAEFNVWFRLLILFVCIVPYCFMLFYIPYNYKRSSANYRWIFNYTVAVQCIGVFYILYMLTASTAVSMAHVACCILFGLLVTYQELFIRIDVPVEPAEEELPLSSTSLQTEDAEDAETTTAVAEPEKSDCPSLWNELVRLMQHEEIWRNPDLSLENLAERLGTNRTTLTQVIRRESNGGYKEFVNRFRMEEFLKNVNTKTLPNIQAEFFKVGFRSKATALRHFKDYTGSTPTDYLRKMADEN